MILRTTPTGDIGARVLRHLLDAHAPVRVVVRDPARLPPDLPTRVDIVQGSHADAAMIGPALDGVDRVFWLPPGASTADTPTTFRVWAERELRPAILGGSRHHASHAQETP